MTTTWAGGTSLSEYDARIRRAERLSAQHSFAPEFLNFYNPVAAFQKTLRADITAAAGTESSNISVAELRVPLDLSVLLPHFRGFLSTIEQRAPAALGKAAHQLSLLPSDSWIASLESYWQHGGKRSEEHTSELQSPDHLVCRLLLEKKTPRITHSFITSPRIPTSACQILLSTQGKGEAFSGQPKLGTVFIALGRL